MEEWFLKSSDLKKYPHFDSVLTRAEAVAIATDKGLVTAHTFYPFLLYEQRWNRFAPKGERGKSKTRPIRYAARRDAYIFAYYRHILSGKYEVALKSLGLDQCVLAYRRTMTSSGGGKCNIHFAQDAFLKVQTLGNCYAIALDISQYFESLDHARLKQLWARMLDVPRLPSDHFQVFKAITSYAVVDKIEAYQRLGHIGPKQTSSAGKQINGYLTAFKKMPKQLCTGREFQQKIAGQGELKSIIRKNRKPYGIPQGAPISDLLANLYLLDFDLAIQKKMQAVGGAYFRYSDDILLIGPGGETEAKELLTYTQTLVTKFGDELEIKDKKTSVLVFETSGEFQTFKLVYGTQGRNGLEYLGFRYDGQRVFLRDSTISNLRRKVARAARRNANICAQLHANKGASELRLVFNYERLTKQFGRVEDFPELQHDYRNWTFWTYAKRAAKIFGAAGNSILRQLRNHRKLVIYRADKELKRAVQRRDGSGLL